MSIKKWIAKTLAVLLLFSTLTFLSGTKTYDEKNFLAEEIAVQLLNEDKEDKQIVYSYDLKGLDGQNDYILVIGQYDGYAIFSKEDLSLIEYSPYGSSPFGNIEKSQTRYAGPANYFVAEKGNVKNIHTQQIIKSENLTEIATQVKQISKRKPVDAEIPIVKEEVSTMSANGRNTVKPYTTIGVGGTDVKDPDKYSVVSRKLISDYEYFLANPYYGYNKTGTCSSVATQLLLSYNNWSKFGKFITNPDFLCVNADYSKPYSKEVISTTSEDDNTDGKQSFYEYLVSQIDPLENGALFINVEYGIQQYINNYVASEYRNLINCNRYQLQTQDNMANIIENEIDNDRPLIVSMVAYQSGDDSFYLENSHAVVVYGYQTFKINGYNVDGYICHTGWDKNINKNENNNSDLGKYNYCWFDKNWLLPSCVTLEIDHNHSFVPYTYVQNGQQITDNHILKCTSCNSVKTTMMHICDKVSQINRPNTGEPDKYYHKETCSCGLVTETTHNIGYIDRHNGTHSMICTECKLELRTQEHTYKYSQDTICFFCGGGSLE